MTNEQRERSFVLPRLHWNIKLDMMSGGSTGAGCEQQDRDRTGYAPALVRCGSRSATAAASPPPAPHPWAEA